ncbi:MAG: molybdenum cofactor guanylyltransferase [Lachnospiraceae bacterium]|nr:molybdenum cofactor guanylyltransferase [Lachnospiraceae bacterium]
MTGDACAVILAGGKSSRMGENKAGLTIEGRTMLELQLLKLEGLGIKEILVSGEPENLRDLMGEYKYAENVRIIPDIIKDRGPLGGLYSCFDATECRYALTISVDSPFITAQTLNELLDDHKKNGADATVLTAASAAQPLIAVYNTCTSTVIRKLLDGDDLSVKALLNRIKTHRHDFRGDASELANCNTREDYEKIIAMT